MSLLKPIYITAIICLSWHVAPAKADTQATTAPQTRQAIPDPEQQVKQMVRTITILSPAAMDKRSLWCGLSARTEWSLAGLGGQLELGYLLKFLGIDGRLSRGQTNYGRFSVAPGYSQLGFATPSSWDPSAELNRPRDGNDRWSYTMIEPGLSINGRMFSRILPLLSERARVGFGYGSFQDSANTIDFTSYLFSVEAAMLWQLGAGSRWSLSGSVNWYTGILISDSDPEQSLSLRRLPLSWLTGSIGLAYSF